MKCFKCENGELESRPTKAEGEIKGKRYTVETPAMVCASCGNVALEGRDAQEFMRRVSDAYRKAHKLLTSDQIRSIRGGLSQLRFAQEIGVGPASVKRWELGLVQDKSNDRLIREFEKLSRKRYVYDVPVRVQVPVMCGSTPEGYAHSPPFTHENSVSPSLL